MKRPVSHRWLMVMSGFITVMMVFLLGRMMREPDRLEALARWWVMLAFFSLGPLMLVVLLAGGRRRWAYYFVSGALTLWVLRLLQSMITQYVTGVALPMDLPTHIMRDLLGGGMLILWWRVLFGKPSREYFGMPTSPPQDTPAERTGK